MGGTGRLKSEQILEQLRARHVIFPHEFRSSSVCTEITCEIYHTDYTGLAPNYPSLFLFSLKGTLIDFKEGKEGERRGKKY